MKNKITLMPMNFKLYSSRLPGLLLIASLAMVVATAVYTQSYVFNAKAQSNAYNLEAENQREHAAMAREVESLSGKIEAMAQYEAELKAAGLRQRVTVLEVNLEIMMKIMWSTLVGLCSLIVNAVFIQAKGWMAAIKAKE